MDEQKFIPIAITAKNAVSEEILTPSFEEAFALPEETTSSLSTAKEPAEKKGNTPREVENEQGSVPRYIPEYPVKQDAVSSVPELTKKEPSKAVYELLEKARAEIQARKQKKLNKVMDFLLKEGRITNRDVQKALRVSDATAFRYLERLEKEGSIEQVGKTGKGVFYRLR
ncbi:MAG: hypothetical protein COU90_01265 [Candidatus Ryanbacteria bacterium CG10_big_fil_rev_8_21_14_0_10_43_42]|uniref:HTH deoR-type domain-containing protein n=1 Tax=Candidatus Ryanbacteria bacterium CG10_big_fil_rev_8_21_14_0_10_43_42 TaxID=1974864 RepID=A0A2M8KXL2_9BACT|nr:MAG: hypothetical protein COU90_01265 [Candidatus Ryanbacteria bacterium CG10_big_fil_rev_8_21_14_0_10_43_42]